ncbi:putative peptidase M36 family protein [Lyophyllum shimeji]|uniref:Extracellular metalloproteinase n=1 Tax=Lyophyllum shimeji TaxID=47721 RepID=A0A9P3PPV6_LYOSH|nr:putative peptidase M36 family protein [Lyophyllum shimeji]
MASFNFNKLLSFVLVAFYASPAHAVPWPLHARHSTHRVRHVGRGLEVKAFYPSSTYQTFGQGIDPPIPQGLTNTSAPLALQDSAIAFVQSHLGVDPTQVGYRTGFTREDGDYAYVNQFRDGVPFANAVANIAWKDGKVVAFGSSFVDMNITTGNIADSKPTLDVNSVIPTAEAALNGKSNSQPPTLEYLVNEDGSVALTHVFQVQNETAGSWYEAYVCAHTGKLLSVTDFVAHASYTVLPIHKETFPEGQEIVTNPQDLQASPFGWHSTDGRTQTTTTTGNNVQAFVGNQVSRQTSAGDNFNVRYDATKDPSVASNRAAATNQAFYVINTVHDFTYRYGFTEQTFNFQSYNFGKGGRGGDRVLISVQDASGVDNANFATPPDGQSGYCRMYVWDFTKPGRDGTLENDIPVHEMTHGVTNRMTGGGTGRCLQTTEAGGLGEGWSDAMADWVSHTSAAVPDFVVGSWVTNNPAGIRSHPYSNNPNVNPLRYSSAAGSRRLITFVCTEIGEVWANMLHNVYAALVAARGFSTTALTNPDTSEGNVVFMHLFLDALLLQPCNPTCECLAALVIVLAHLLKVVKSTVVSARDAWIQADQNRYGGANKCTVYKAFASRGLGYNAKPDFVDNTDLPPGCS